MKYELDDELQHNYWPTMPKCMLVYPVINLYLGVYKPKSDDRVNVRVLDIPGTPCKNYLMDVGTIEDDLPFIFYIHGGGALLEASETHYEIAKMYARSGKYRVVLVNYPLMPTYRYPVAIESIYATYLWVKEHAKQLKIDVEHSIVVGDSMGGNLSVALTRLLHDRKQNVPDALVLTYPVLDKNMNYESMRKYTDTPVWNSKLNVVFWNEYLKDIGNYPLKYASIMDEECLAYFPRTYVEVAEYDCLHDEGVAFVERLKEVGVETECQEVSKAPHGYEAAYKSELVKNLIEKRLQFMQGENT